MALTTAELQANLIAQQQAEAANIVALIESVVDGRIAIVDVDLEALAAKVAAVNSLLDGDPTNEGFQAFIALVARVVALETASTEHGAAIALLQSALAAQGVALNTRIDDLDFNTSASLTLLGDRLTTAEAQVSAETLRSMSKDAEHDAGIASLNSTAISLQDALTIEAGRALAAEVSLNDAVGVERARIDALAILNGNFVTRNELSADGQFSGQAFINRLLAGKTRPGGLPNTDGTTSV